MSCGQFPVPFVVTRGAAEWADILQPSRDAVAGPFPKEWLRPMSISQPVTGGNSEPRGGIVDARGTSLGNQAATRHSTAGSHEGVFPVSRDTCGLLPPRRPHPGSARRLSTSGSICRLRCRAALSAGEVGNPWNKSFLQTWRIQEKPALTERGYRLDSTTL